MNALSALHSRNSINMLCEPGPTVEQVDHIVKAGLRACDHGNLTPWKYLVIEGDARHRFGELMVQVKNKMEDGTLSKEMAKKLQAKPLRAPMIIAVAARITEHPKVPEIEQLLSAGASAQMMMTAAHAQGIGAIWRSGSLMFHPDMRDGLGLQENDQLVGFIYLGTPKAAKPLPELNTDDFVSYWQG